MSFIADYGWLGRVIGAAALFSFVFMAATAAAAEPPAGGSPASPPGPPPNVGRPTGNQTSGAVDGYFVDFTVPGQDAIIESFASEGVAFFDSVSVAGYALENWTTYEALVTVTGAGASAMVHDNPSSVLQLTLEAGSTALFDLSDGIGAAWEQNGSIDINASGVNRSGALWTTCGLANMTLDAAASTIEVAAGTRCHVFFRSHVLEPARDDAISGAAQSGALVAEIFAGGSSEEGSDVTEFGEVEVIVARAPDRLLVTVASDAGAPASVLVRFVPPGAGETLVILVDGEPAQYAAGLGDALDPTDDGGVAEASFERAGANAFVVVSLPGPGAHVIELKTIVAAVPAPRTEPSPVILGAVLGFAVAAFAALALFRRS